MSLDATMQIPPCCDSVLAMSSLLGRLYPITASCLRQAKRLNSYDFVVESNLQNLEIAACLSIFYQIDILHFGLHSYGIDTPLIRTMRFFLLLKAFGRVMEYTIDISVSRKLLFEVIQD